MKLVKENCLYLNNKSTELGSLVKGFVSMTSEFDIDFGKRLCVVSEDPLVLVSAVLYFFENLSDAAVYYGRPEEVSDLYMNIYYFRGEKVETIASTHKIGFTPARISIINPLTNGSERVEEHEYQSLYDVDFGLNATKQQWLMTFHPGTLGWYKTLAKFMFVLGQNLVISNKQDPVSIFDVGVRNKANNIVSDQKFWRNLLDKLGEKELKRLDLERIVLEDKEADQEVIGALEDIYPSAAISLA